MLRLRVLLGHGWPESLLEDSEASLKNLEEPLTGSALYSVPVSLGGEVSEESRHACLDE